AGLSGLQNIMTTSAEGVSYVALEFGISTDANTAASDTERALATIKATLPDEAKAPVIVKYDFSGPIMQATLQGSLPPDQLFNLADQKLAPLLQTVPGVSRIKLVGGREREVQVRFDPEKLRAYRLSVDQLRAALASENVNVPGGALDEAGKEYNARLVGLYGNPSDLLGLAVAVRPSGTVYLRDVATVQDTTKKATLLYRSNGQNAIGFTIQKTSDANSVQTAAGLRDRIAEVQKTLPAGTRLTVSFDSSTFIRDSLNGVQENLLEAILLTGLVLLLFLHTWRSTVIVLLAIPTSLVATYGVMMVAGFSLNLLTLLALALSIGVLVDDSIVVLENIFRHLEKGKPARQAAIDGRSEIGVAALAITLVDVVVYTPLGFLTGIVGQFFREFGFSVVAAVLFSLLASFTLTPMLASRWLTARPALERLTLFQRFGAWWDGGFQRLERMYERLLSWSLDHRKTIFAASILSVVLALSYFPLHLLGTEFIPTADEGVFTVEAHMPPGTELAVTDRAARELEGKLRAIPEVKQVLMSVGTGNESGFQGEDSPRLMESIVTLEDRSERRRSVDQILPQVNQILTTIPGLTGRTQLPSASGSGQPFVLNISGEDPQAVANYAKQIEALVRRTKGTRDVTDSNAAGAPELDAVVDHSKVADLGLTSLQVASVLRTGLTGDVVTQLRPPGQKQVDVRLISQGGSATKVEDLAALPILTNRGTTVRLDQV
ncbi:MAG: efflux RND transporter permease subunit, partial [Chloroflexota bacterium]|nr:efflux RND transporter permease subunit [Chloroflexota bacterium]